MGPLLSALTGFGICFAGSTVAFLVVPVAGRLHLSSAAYTYLGWGVAAVVAFVAGYVVARLYDGNRRGLPLAAVSGPLVYGIFQLLLLVLVMPSTPDNPLVVGAVVLLTPPLFAYAGVRLWSLR